MNQDILPIRKLGKSGPNTRDTFAIAAVGIQTPQGKRLIPNPTGRESMVFESLEEALKAVHQAGFAGEFEGQLFASSQGINTPAVPSSFQLQGSQLEQSIPLLIERLKDPETTVVAHAALALGALQAQQAVGPLCQVLAHEDGNVRKHVAEALAKLGHGVIPHLQKAWENTHSKPSDAKTPYIRLTIMTACTQWAQRQRQLPPALLTIALNGLNDTSWLVRSQAALAIAQAASSVEEA